MQGLHRRELVQELHGGVLCKGWGEAVEVLHGDALVQGSRRMLVQGLPRGLVQGLHVSARLARGHVCKAVVSSAR